MTECTFPACLCQEAHELSTRINRAAKHMGISNFIPSGPTRVRGLCPNASRWVPLDPHPAEFHLKERWRKYGWWE